MGTRHDGDGVTTSACRHIQAPAASDKVAGVALLKLDGYNTSDGAKATYTLWVDAAGSLRILKGESIGTGATASVGTVVGAQAAP